MRIRIGALRKRVVAKRTRVRSGSGISHMPEVRGAQKARARVGQTLGWVLMLLG